MNQKYLFILFFISLRSATCQSWQQLTDFPGSARDDGSAFVIDNKAYCGTGSSLSPPYACNDFYSLDLNTNTWSAAPSMPAGKERQYACGFSYSGAGFIIAGITGGTTFLSDVWKYDTAATSWIEKTSLPSYGRQGAAFFVIDSVIYIVGGDSASHHAVNEVWAYDIKNDSWQQKDNLPFGARFRASATAVNGKGYLIFGRDETERFCRELFEYDPSSDSWTQIDLFPGNGRNYSTLQSINGDLVLVGGVDTAGTHYNDMWRYNLNQSTWQQLVSLPAGRKGGMCFTYGSSIYYTTGNDASNSLVKDSWKCDNPTGIKESLLEATLKLFPIPAHQSINLQSPFASGNGTMSILSTKGDLVLEKKLSSNNQTIDVSGFSNGLYFIHIQEGNKIISMKFVKE